MIISIPKEVNINESRIAIIPSTVKEYIKKGFSVQIESGAGDKSFISDKEFQLAGASITKNAQETLQNADLVLKVNAPTFDVNTNIHEVDLMKDNSALISFFQTSIEQEALKKIVEKKISGFSMHNIPRTTLAQKMDALSSQSNIAGYKAVLVGSTHIGKYMPLLMTAAGTIQPSKVLIIGAGVAGLQAIATSKRLGAQVEAFDVRPVVKEQVESLGAKFIEVPADENEGVGDGGYAKETSEKYKKKQAELLKNHISKSDLVITTALIPGRPAPKIITDDMVETMKGGTAIMDLASENGGNCTLTKPGEVYKKNGVIIDGSFNIPGTMPIHASQLYAKNVVALVKHVFSQVNFEFDLKDEIVSGSLYTHNGKIIN